MDPLDASVRDGQPLPMVTSSTETTGTFTAAREIPAAVEQVFAAISHPERLARWWGPAGFTNTFAVCEFTPGGRWKLIMHGPDGQNYPNDNLFTEIDAPHRVVVQHVGQPRFHLTISLAATAMGTLVGWRQCLEDPVFAKRIEPIIVPANEENLDRLTAEVLRRSPPA